MREDESREYLSSVTNALRLLRLFSSREAVRVSEAATELGIGRSTAHRLLTTLEREGFVDQDPASKSYRIGLTVTGSGAFGSRLLDIRDEARPHLEALSQELGETVNLITRHGRYVTFVDCVESHHALRIGNRVGLQQLTHCNSVGKALLATLTDKAILVLYPEASLPGMTAWSLSSRADLLREVEVIRTRGFAVNNQESTLNVVAVGAAIPSGWGHSVGIGVSIPRSRLKPEVDDITTIAGIVVRTAQEVADAVTSGIAT